MDHLTPFLAEHRFRDLFVDALGWEHSAAGMQVSVDGRNFNLAGVAHKRGFQVLVCETDWLAMVNRRLLREVRRIVARTFHEHILVFVNSHPGKQVWQWAIRLEDGRRFKHREHPFYSSSPPKQLLSRLHRLRFTLEEEASVSLVDALYRVREVLDASAEQNLFVKHPKYAERSDQLFRAARNGDRAAYERFITMHLPLARKISRRYVHAYRIDPDDAEQIAAMGMLNAAGRYKPERGFQFSTYATCWIKQACQRECPKDATLIDIPEHMVWPFYRARRELDRAFATDGPEGVQHRQMELFQQEPRLESRWLDLIRCDQIRTLNERSEPEWQEVRSIVDDLDGPAARLLRQEVRGIVRHALSRISPRFREILEWRFGLNGDAMTLEQISTLIKVTRERVRQLEVKARAKLLATIQLDYPNLAAEIRELRFRGMSDEDSDQDSDSRSASRSSRKNSRNDAVGIS